MKLNDILAYVAARGASLQVHDGRLRLQNASKLSELCRSVLFNRRAEIYQHFRLQMPDTELDILEKCPHCGHSFLCEDKEVVSETF